MGQKFNYSLFFMSLSIIDFERSVFDRMITSARVHKTKANIANWIDRQFSRLRAMKLDPLIQLCR